MIERIQYFLPITMIGLSIGSSLIFFAGRDIRNGIYYLASAILLSAVTL
jgi:hypothetical protein